MPRSTCPLFVHMLCLHILCLQFDPKASIAGKDFTRYVAKDKRDVHKLSLNQSWQAALHDPYYPKD